MRRLRKSAYVHLLVLLAFKVVRQYERAQRGRERVTHEAGNVLLRKVDLADVVDERLLVGDDEELARLVPVHVRRDVRTRILHEPVRAGILSALR